VAEEAAGVAVAEVAAGEVALVEVEEAAEEQEAAALLASRSHRPRALPPEARSGWRVRQPAQRIRREAGTTTATWNR
jgi:hypothetical protein